MRRTEEKYNRTINTKEKGRLHEFQKGKFGTFQIMPTILNAAADMQTLRRKFKKENESVIFLQTVKEGCAMLVDEVTQQEFLLLCFNMSKKNRKV